ncbi:isoprenyl transferase [Bacteroidia bacterium]|nr:isoprenyl transferase [Bacteroidia bacterium]
MNTNNAQPNNIPQHVAIIMDGNGRWAKQRGWKRVMGHQNGIAAVRAATETAAQMGVKFLTLYAFSTENWQRSQSEVDALMSLLVDAIEKEVPELQKNKVRLLAIGNMQALPPKVAQKFERAIAQTAGNTGLTLIIALSYSGRWEIVDAAKRLCTKVLSKQLQPNDITEEEFARVLQTSAIPDPDLFIRTGGDQRISNFLLWQLAYTELHFADVLWPDFRREHFVAAIADYQQRERRFGKVNE